MTGHRTGKLWIGLFTALALIGCGSDVGDPNDPPDGPNLAELMVNSSSVGNGGVIEQYTAAGTDGQFVTVWDTEENFTGGGFRRQVRAQRVDADGRKAGPELEVSTPQENGFLPWSGFGSPVRLGPSGEAVFGFLGAVACNPLCVNGILGRRFQADGTPTGASFQVNSSGSQGLGSPSLALGPGGAAVFVWLLGMDIRAQRMGADGSKLGSEILVRTLRDVSSPEVDVASDGSFLVTYRTETDLRGRRFSAGGTPVGGEFVLVQDAGGAAAMAANGQIIAVYGREGGQILVRRFASGGTPLGAEVQVSASLGGYARVSAAGDGRFAVAWAQAPQDGVPANSIQVQRFAADGSKLGGVVQANASQSIRPGPPSLALAPSGRLLVTWADYNTRAIRGRLLVP